MDPIFPNILHVILDLFAVNFPHKTIAARRRLRALSFFFCLQLQREMVKNDYKARRGGLRPIAKEQLSNRSFFLLRKQAQCAAMRALLIFTWQIFCMRLPQAAAVERME